MRIDTPDQGSMVFYVDGGFAQVLDNEVIILTERAAAAADIVRPEAEKALAAAEQMPLLGEEALQARNRAIARAKAQLRIAPK
jgi:F0F1-type ATP synthase epsilon subunit